MHCYSSGLAGYWLASWLAVHKASGSTPAAALRAVAAVGDRTAYTLSAADDRVVCCVSLSRGCAVQKPAERIDLLGIECRSKAHGIKWWSRFQ